MHQALPLVIISFKQLIEKLNYKLKTDVFEVLTDFMTNCRTTFNLKNIMNSMQQVPILQNNVQNVNSNQSYNNSQDLDKLLQEQISQQHTPIQPIQPNQLQTNHSQSSVASQMSLNKSPLGQHHAVTPQNIQINQANMQNVNRFPVNQTQNQPQTQNLQVRNPTGFPPNPPNFGYNTNMAPRLIHPNSNLQRPPNIQQANR